MPPLSEEVALPGFVAFGLLLVGWYLVGNEVMRRRARLLSLWCKRAVDPMGGQQAVRWLTTQSFRLEVSGARAPVESAAITGLVESWDVPFIWLWNRLNGRRDMVVLQLRLVRPPRFGLELFRPGSVLAGDARDLGRREGWREQSCDELRLVSPGEAADALARALLSEIGDQRAGLVRLALRRRDVQLSLAFNIPDPRALDPAAFHRMVGRLVEAATR